MKSLTIPVAKSLPYGDLPIRKELDEELARMIQEEIDWEIMRNLLLESGWSLVTISKNGKNFEDVKTWCEENIKGRYRSRYDSWVFEKPEDASWFVLRWK